jgi:hypothetical protein
MKRSLHFKSAKATRTRHVDTQARPLNADCPGPGCVCVSGGLSGACRYISDAAVARGGVSEWERLASEARIDAAAAAELGAGRVIKGLGRR